MDILFYALAVLATLTLLAIVHEGGHCLGAKLTGIAVATYEIGTGPALLRWTDRRGTRYKLGLVPLGALTKLREATGEGDPAPVTDAGAGPGGRLFRDAAPARKLVVTLAGAGANFIVAFLILLALQIGNLPRAEPIAAVDAGGPAFDAGLRTGDRIAAIDGVATASWQDVGLRLADRVGDSGALAIDVLRDGQAQRLPVAISDWQSDRRLIDSLETLGIGHGHGAAGQAQDASLLARMGAAVEETAALVFSTAMAAIKVLLGDISIVSFAGPLQLSQLGVGERALEWADYLKLFAMFSIAGGLINLLPGPIVDGTGASFALAELVSGKPLSARTERVGTHVGAVVGLAPLGVVVLHELSRLLA